MKFTNVKQLIIKFMGGGLINFPTRFLRWVKINGDIEGDDSGGGGDDSGGSSQEELDFINQAVNILKNSFTTPISINAWDDIKTTLPETIEKIGDENNADYVIAGVSPIPGTEDVNFTAIFLTEDEYNIVWNIIITSTKSYLKGCLVYNKNEDGYQYTDESDDSTYLNFDFVFLITNPDTNETLVFDDIDVERLGNIQRDSNGYRALYVPYTELNNNFLFKFNFDTNITEFTKNVSIDTENPVEVNGVNYYLIVYGSGDPS